MRVLSVTALTALLLVTWTTPPAEAGTYKGKCTDSVTLGSERWPELKRLRGELRERLSVADYTAAVALQREIADMQCHNHFLRYYLAELMMQADDTAGAVEVLEGLYDLGVNDLEVRFADPANPLHPIAASEAYAGSALAKKVAAKRAEHAARQARFQARLAALPADAKPPEAYVARDVCPFECCAYQRWSVLADTALVVSPGSTESAGIARAGTYVDGLTGEVHVAPVPVAVVHPERAFEPQASAAVDEIIFVVDYQGEGYAHVWRSGTVHSMSVIEEVRDQCPFPDDSCWGEFLVPADQRPESVWWVKVRLPDGSEGWTSDINFDEMSGCG